MYDHYYDSVKVKNGGATTPRKRVNSNKSTPKRSGKSTPLSNRVTATNLYPFIAEYDYEEFLNPKKTDGEKQVTCIKKNYACINTTPLSEIEDVISDPAVARALKGKRYVVSAYLLKFTSLKLKDIVMLYNSATKEVSKYGEEVNKQEKENMRRIYHFTMVLKDQSLEGSDKSVPVYILTNEIDQNLFDLWGILPSPDDWEAWESFTAKDTLLFERKFAKLKALDHIFKLVVELMITNNGQPFLKLYDTIFLP